MVETKQITSVCVYCGSRSGKIQDYADAAKSLGKWIGTTNRTLVYGAGSIGLMGIVADAALQHNADVIGIIPGHLDAVEITQQGMTETIITQTMHERKNLMFEKSDAFIVLPGGFGSMDEFFEMLTWAQLRLHCKPIYILNINDYWSPLIDLMDHMIAEGFADESNKNLFTVFNTLSDLTAALEKGYIETFKSQDKFL